MSDEELYKKLERQHLIHLFVWCFLLGVALGLYVYAVMVVFGWI